MTVGFDRAIQDEAVAPFRLVLAPVSMSQCEQTEYEKLTRDYIDAMRILDAEQEISHDGTSVMQQLNRLSGGYGRIGKAARSAQSALRKRRRLLAGVGSKIDAVEELSDLVESRMGTVVFAQSKEAAEQVAASFRGWNIAASALHSGMDIIERRECLARIGDGSLKMLASPRLLDEGIDVPSIDLGIVMTASRSRRQMIQRLGRVIRKKADGRSVDFVIIFAKKTVEDPRSGAHEGFFDLVSEVAIDQTVLDPGLDYSDVSARDR